MYYNNVSFPLSQTLLARATYDNHADAPDELNIRKGDIVTVIEKDIDGLVGWWLCLLHGQQGIVPGNRLQVIDPMQLVQMERKTTASKKRASYETDSDSHDVTDGIHASLPPASSNYDYLPNPVKTPGFVPQLSIKDMFDIPLKVNSTTTPSKTDTNVTDGITASQELYDVPSSLNSTLDTSRSQQHPQDIYDIPLSSNRSSSSNRNSANLSQQSGYDSPRSGRKDYTANTEQDGLPSTETYDVPANLSQTSQYDSPRSSRNGHESQETYDVPANLTQRRSAPKQPAPYQTPKQNKTSTTDNTDLTTSVDELYDVPSKSKSRVASLDVDELMGEILDSPFNADSPATSTIKRRTPSNSNHSTPRGSYIAPNLDTSQEIYDVPPSHQQHSGAATDGPRKNLHLQSPATNSLSHTLPRGFSPKNSKNKNNNIGRHHTPTRLQDIYNLPQSNDSVDMVNRSLPGSPPNSRRAVASSGDDASQEIYDVPAPRNNPNEPTSNPEFLSMLRQLELGGSAGQSQSNRSSFDSTHSANNHTKQQFTQDVYDVPTHPSSNRSSFGSTASGTTNNVSQYQNTLLRNQQQQQEIYDVPPSHSRDASTEIYDVPPTSARSQNNNNNNVKRYSAGRDLDDFAEAMHAGQTSTPRDNSCDPQEIYDTPPPASMMRASNEKLTQQRNSYNGEIYDVPPNASMLRASNEKLSQKQGR